LDGSSMHMNPTAAGLSATAPEALVRNGCE
jgi:hypothetical protein